MFVIPRATMRKCLKIAEKPSLEHRTVPRYTHIHFILWFLICSLSKKVWPRWDSHKNRVRAWLSPTDPMWKDLLRGLCHRSEQQPLPHSPIFLMYQLFPPWDPFQNRAPTELTRAMTRRMPNSTRICTLVTFSTFDLLRGAFVEFCKPALKVSNHHRISLGQG